MTCVQTCEQVADDDRYAQVVEAVALSNCLPCPVPWTVTRHRDAVTFTADPECARSTVWERVLALRSVDCVSLLDEQVASSVRVIDAAAVCADACRQLSAEGSVTLRWKPADHPICPAAVR